MKFLRFIPGPPNYQSDWYEINLPINVATEENKYFSLQVLNNNNNLLGWLHVTKNKKTYRLQFINIVNVSYRRKDTKLIIKPVSISYNLNELLTEDILIILINDMLSMGQHRIGLLQSNLNGIRSDYERI